MVWNFKAAYNFRHSEALIVIRRKKSALNIFHLFLNVFESIEQVINVGVRAFLTNYFINFRNVVTKASGVKILCFAQISAHQTIF